MPRIRYTSEEKEDALRLCDEIGVPKASEQTGITAKTLYKWRTDVEEDLSAAVTEEDADSADEADPEKEGKASTRKRYTAEQKEEALRLCEQIGVTKASRETGITINSLRKWRAEAQNKRALATETPSDENTLAPDNENQSTAIIARLSKAPEDDAREANELISAEDPIAVDEAPIDADQKEETPPLLKSREASAEGTREELIRVRVENAALKAQIASLKNALRVFTE